MHTLIIDGDNVFKIGFFGRKDLYNKEQHIGGIVHFLDTLRLQLEHYRYDKVVVFWDGPNNISFRTKIYPYYKQNRRGRILSENEISSKQYQRVRIQNYLEELFVRQGVYENVETDDCIAYYCDHSYGEEKTILSGDGDLTQLISEHTRICLPKQNTFITIGDKVVMDGIEVLPQNVWLVKTICGDSTDNIAGIRGMGIKTLHEHVPQISTEVLTLEGVLQYCEHLLKENSTKALQNLLSGTSKYGVLQEEFFQVNRQIVDLRNFFLTEEAITHIRELIYEPLDPEGRDFKNVQRMMVEDGVFRYLPKDERWVLFLRTLKNLGRKEKKNFNQ